MKQKMTLTLLLTISCAVFAQDFRKIGIGVGYHSTSIVGDSVRPFELSLRYRINNKHTVQVYSPLWLKKDKQNVVNWADFVSEEHKKLYNHTYINSLWGIGLGYDYAFYSYSYFDFFAGLSADFQWYEFREDYYHIEYKQLGSIDDRPPVYDDFYKMIETYYFWDRVRGISIIPTTGFRFTKEKVTLDVKLGLYFSKFNKKAYYFGKEKGIFDKEWMSTWESFYSDKYMNEFCVQPDISFNLIYYF